MKARPIIFSGAMVRALLDGRKTQTRRVCKEQDLLTFLGNNSDEVGIRWVAPTNDAGKREHEQWCAYCEGYPEEGVIPLGVGYGQPGDLLYVRENWAQRLDRDHLNGSQLYDAGVRTAFYWADGPGKCCNTGCNGAAGRVRVARFMPRWASRLTLQLTDVRVERIREISEADALAEGVEGIGPRQRWAVERFREPWGSINAARGYGWGENPWVWALSYRVIHANVDDVLAEPERYLPATNRSETA